MIRMAKPYPFPDPNDRSPNTPIDTVPGVKVLELYNRCHKDDKMQKVTTKVQNWMTETAKTQYSWDSVEFAGSECILRVKMQKFKTPDE